MAFRIVTAQQDVIAFIGDVQAAADSEREALGFIPAVAYGQAVGKGEIILVVEDHPQATRYAGHIWVSGTYPHARVVQLCVGAEYRGRRLSTRLLRAAIQAAEDLGYISIKANVADDLIAANRVYEHHGFDHAKTKPGGKVRKRQIHVRVKELATPTLFNYRPNRSVVMADIGGGPEEQPLYLLDLNVFFDATRKRKATPAAGRIVAAAFNNGVRLAVTTEFVKELERTAISKDDPVLSFAKQLPAVSGPPRQQIDALATRLAGIVFPEQNRDASLSRNDEADLRHLAEGILVGAAGFVTGEKAIVRAQAALREQFRLTVWSTEEFAALVSPAFAEVHGTVHADHDLSFQEEAFSSEAQLFLKANGASDEIVGAFSRRDAADKRFTYVAARESDVLVAFSAFRAAANPVEQARLLVVANQRHPAMPTATDYLIEYAVRAAAATRPSRIEMIDLPDQVATRRAAIANGFLAPRRGVSGFLQKVSLGTVMTPSSWRSVRGRIETGVGLALPALCPVFDNDEQGISIALDGKEDSIPLIDLETMMSPGLFLLPDRPVAIVPIQRVWAEDLIGGSQLSLLAKPEAAFRSRRVYFASAVNQRNLVRGRPIIMYESSKNGGRGAAIAIARVAKAEVIVKANAPEALLRAAVVRGAQLDKLTKGTTVLAVWFDNIMRFGEPVSFKRLRAMGVDDKTNLVRSHLVKFDTAAKIIDAGHPHAR